MRRAHPVIEEVGYRATASVHQGLKGKMFVLIAIPVLVNLSLIY